MNSLKTLYFPITDINCQRQFPLFLFFRSLHLLSIMEQKDGPGSADSFMDSGFCQVHTPAPLGKERDRFSRLLQDILSRQDDYADQLRNLTLAAFSEQDDESDSEESILEALTGSSPQKDPEAEKQKEELWQARLVLGLAEILDREEEEVAHHLALLEEESKEIISTITGDTNLTEDDTALSTLGDLQFRRDPIHAGDMRRRLASWLRLYRNGAIDTYKMLLTTSPTCGEKLLEDFQNITTTEPLQLSTFNLPQSLGANQKEALEVAQHFVSENLQLIEEIENTVAAQLTTSSSSDPTALSELTRSWNSVVEQSFPAELNGRQELRISQCRGMNSDALLSQAESGRDKHENKNKNKNGNVLLAIVS